MSETEEICGESTPLIQRTMLCWSVVKFELRCSFNVDVSYMDTGLDAALSGTLNGME